MTERGASRIAVAIVLDRGKTLIGPRPDNAPLAGLWEFPGGRVGPGESADAAAVRECFEETALRVQVERERAVVEHRYEHAAVEIHFFDASLIEPRGQPAPPFRWVDLRSLDRYAFPPANRDIIAQLLAEFGPPTRRVSKPPTPTRKQGPQPDA